METKLTVDGKLEVITPTSTVYDYDSLVIQRKRFQEEKDAYVLEADRKLAELDALIAECEKLGIKPKSESEEREDLR